MKTISARFNSMKRASDDIDNICRKVASNDSDISRVLRELNYNMPSFDIIRKSLINSARDIDRVCSDTARMATVLRTITNQYISTEKSIMAGRFSVHLGEAINAINQEAVAWTTNWIGMIIPWLIPGPWGTYRRTQIISDWISKWWKHRHDDKIRYKVDSIVFDDEGSYGGNQGSPKGTWWNPWRRKELFEVIERNTGRTFTAAERDAYLKKLNSEGCGYVAIVNTIFAEYEGRPGDFEKTFGYPMYHNGDLNYDMLIADIYSSMDNTDGHGHYDAYHDYDSSTDGNRSDYSVWKDKSGFGIYPSEQATYVTEFMKDHGVTANAHTNVNVTAENFEQLSRSGKHVIVNFYYGNLLNMDGSVGQYIDGGHAMTVTGVTNDGHLIVSSWGKEYMIDPNVAGTGASLNFTTIEYP